MDFPELTFFLEGLRTNLSSFIEENRYMTVDAEFEAHKIADEQTKVQAELDQHIANLAQLISCTWK